MREHIQKVRDLVANKDNETPETLRTATNELQQASLKLFEILQNHIIQAFSINSVGVTFNILAVPFLIVLNFSKTYNS